LRAIFSALKSLIPDPAHITVVDDDQSVRESLQGLLKSMGFAVKTFDSSEAFLESDSLPVTQCLILDVRMPGMSGLDLQRELAASARQIPIVFVTAHYDANLRSRVLAEGALACLRKPFAEQELLSAVSAALGIESADGDAGGGAQA